MVIWTFEGDVQKTRKQLLEYCELDTFAMVKILEKLLQVYTDFIENSEKFFLKKLEFFQKIQKNLERGIHPLWRSRFQPK